MKKNTVVFMLILLLLPVFAFGEVIAIGDMVENETYSGSTLLMDGDTLHILRHSKTGETIITEYPDYTITDVVYTKHVRCYALQEDHTFLPCDKHCGTRIELDGIKGVCTSPDGHTYVVDDRYHLLQWTPDQDQPWQELASLDTTGLALKKEDDAVTNCLVVQDGHAYMSFDNETGTETTLYEFDCATGSRRSVCTMAWLRDVECASQGKILVCGNKTSGFAYHYLVDVKTGEMEKVQIELPEFMTDTVLTDDGWYVCGATSIYKVAFDETKTKLFALSGSYGRQMALDSQGKNLYVLQIDNQLAIYPLAQQTEVQQLRVVGDLSLLREVNGYVPSLADFNKGYGEVELVQASRPESFQEIAQALVLEDDSFDLMLLSVQQADMESLFDKGYYVSLSGFDSVKTFVTKMFPVYQEHCMWGDEIAALPVFTYNRTMLWNQDLWNSCEIPSVPQTWDEFFDCIEWLDAESYLDSYPLFSDNGSRYPDAYTRILQYLLNGHCASAAGDGEAFTWKDADLQRLLERLQALENVIRRNEAYAFSEDGFFYPEASLSVLESTSGNVLYSAGYGEEYSPLLLAMSANEDASLTASLTVLVVNPYGKHAELAAQLCAYIAQNPTPYQRCIFLQEGKEGIRTEDFAAWVEEWQKDMDEVTSAINDLDKDNTNALTALMDREVELQRLWMEKERKSWLVTQASAERYHACVPALWIRTRESADIVDNYGEKALEKFTEGTLSADELLNSLEKLLLTMRMEKQ